MARAKKNREENVPVDSWSEADVAVSDFIAEINEEIDTSRAEKILADEPQDSFIDENFKPPKPNPKDFEVPIEVEEETEEVEEIVVEEVETEPAETPEKKEKKEEETEKEEEKEKRKLDPAAQEKVDKIREKVIKNFLKPESVVAFTSMFLSRSLSLIPRTHRDDWKFDEEEKEILAELIEATIEEEGIEFWPVKVWLILSLIVIVSFKGFDVYGKYYSEDGEKRYIPEKKRVDAQEKYDRRIMELTIKTEELEFLEKEEKMKEKIRDIEERIRSKNEPKEEGAIEDVDFEEVKEKQDKE